MRAVAHRQLGIEPFTVAQARAAGLRWHHLQAREWTRLSRGQYVSTDVSRETEVILRAVEQRLPADHAFAGRTAAWLFGLDVSPLDPVEVIVGRELPIRSRAGIKVRRVSLPSSDVLVHQGFRATTRLRTVRDLGSSANFAEALVAVDMALRTGLIDLSELLDHVATHSGDKGIRRLRRVVRFADPRPESPMESRLRAELIQSHLPVPCIQQELFDRSGEFVGRADLYYPDRRLLVEYDGANHKERLVADLRRQNALVNAGYHLLRFTAPDLRIPGAVGAQVRRARQLLQRRVSRD